MHEVQQREVGKKVGIFNDMFHMCNVSQRL